MGQSYSIPQTLSLKGDQDDKFKEIEKTDNQLTKYEHQLIGFNSLAHKLKMSLVDQSIIQSIKLCKAAILQYSKLDRIVYHSFIIFKTQRYWWSLQKFKEGFVLQKSINENTLVNLIQDENRCKPIQKDEFKQFFGLKIFLNWIQSTQQLSKQYNLLTSNCNHFANKVYKYFKKQFSIIYI